MKYLYLHGFASGPGSGKARYFLDRFAARAIDLHIPDLAAGDFENLTITSQLRVVERAAAGEPVALIGSSMGGYLSALFASTHPEVSKVALLAPAFQFLQRWPDRLGAAVVDEWKRTGLMEVFHYGDGRTRRLSYSLIEDARRYPAVPGFDQPALIFHGTRDDVVDSACSQAFAADHPNAVLRLLDSDHQLTDSVDLIWSEMERFLLG